jgi:hypothetical protein
MRRFNLEMGFPGGEGTVVDKGALRRAPYEFTALE